MGRVKTRLDAYPSRREAWNYTLGFRRVTGIVTGEASRQLTSIPLVARNGCSDEVAPFRPTPIVVADLLITE